MSNLEVYYDNHSKALKFPWSIYHKPLLEDLDRFLKLYLKPGMKILVIGPGDFQEFNLISSYKAKIYLLDIDPRVIENNTSKLGNQIEKSYVVGSNFEGYPENETFDIIYAKEVIEHIPLSEKFLSRLNNLCSHKGKVWISTPNYGFFLLPLLESTVLELVARLSGFSRKHIHPSKFSKKSLLNSVKEAGFKKVKGHETFLKLALSVTAFKDP
jgi:2-polyprenyl-3-methyl-5-hydroxy-6-metoxy-1,4-benzoquinol methylase